MESNPILKLKEEIKELAEQQVKLKPQRKTVHLVVKRLIHPMTAANMHADNRFRLRHMYLAYGLLRGKTVKQIESNSEKPYTYNERTVSKLIEKYSLKAVRVSA